MILLRSLLYALILGLFTPVFVTTFLLFFWLPLRQRHLFCRGWVWTALWLIRHVLGIRYVVEGRENIPPGACVVMAKHQSAWETIALQQVFLGSVFVLKKELHWLPFFGWALALNPMIAINRSAQRDALKLLAKLGKVRLDAGYRVVIYPEGTRIAPGQKGEYKRGGAFLAKHAGYPVVPVAHNAGELWRRNAFIKRPGTVTVCIGPAIAPAGLSTEEITRRAEEWIEGQMHRISPHRYAAETVKEIAHEAP
ncbi:MAG TPA: 1-acyl-sn-glycerol-3-phosphate acyltransferase [Rhodocyclaceae bacterium]